MQNTTENPTAPVGPNDRLYRIRRNDGRWALNYTFDSREEAEREAHAMYDENRPFRYTVVEVQPEAQS